VLGAVAEQALCQRWRDRHDISAAHRLTGGYLCLVVKIAMSYRGYGPASEDLIGEAYIGLMHAVCQFDPDRGVSFATFAIWWVRATIIECILSDRTSVRMGAEASREKLFASLRRLHGHLREFRDLTLKSEAISGMAELPRSDRAPTIARKLLETGNDKGL
jgi:RNA polymerase sigma-32 factor